MASFSLLKTGTQYKKLRKKAYLVIVLRIRVTVEMFTSLFEGSGDIIERTKDVRARGSGGMFSSGLHVMDIIFS